MSNRVIKEQVIESESLAAVSAEAERLYWRVVVMADDWGWLAADPVALRPRALPRLVEKVTLTQFEGWIDELLAGDHPLAELWVFRGKPFLRLTGAAERNGQPIHFTVRASKSKHLVADALDRSTRVHRCEQLHAAVRRCEQPQATASNGKQPLAVAARNGNGNGNGNGETKELPAGAGGSRVQEPPQTAELTLSGQDQGPPSASADRTRFEAWWVVYRTRTGRGTDKEDTWQAYQRLPEADKAHLLERTEAWFAKREAIAAAKAFVAQPPDPKRFIRKHRWDDELAVPPGRASPGGEGRDWATFKPDMVIGEDDDEPNNVQPHPAG